MKILISGFRPFDQFKVNPSEQLVNLLVNEKMDFDLTGIILPVSFNKAFNLLKEKIDLIKPDFVVGFGLAFNRDEITPERVALNIIEARIPDNEGIWPVGEKINNKKEDGIFSDLPIKSMVQASRKSGVKCSVSNSAGTYVCNYLMFETIQYGKKIGYKSGFIHIPPTPEIKPGIGSMELNQIKRGVVEMLNVLGENDNEKNIVNVEGEA